MNVLAAAMACASLARASIIAGYAPGWKDLAGANLAQFTHINLAYAEPLANGSLALATAGHNLGEMAARIHRAGSRALLALGGWSGSAHFSTVLKDGTDRARLVASIADGLRDNSLDGVTIDWIANDCNAVDVHSDAANLLALLRELRSALGAAFPGVQKTVALGVGMAPFAGPDGPLRDVSEYAGLVDYINILAYDVNGPWANTTGPNAPLSYQAGSGSQTSLIAAVDAWTAAKFPARQITAGIPFYGRAATALQDMSAEPWNMYQPREDAIPNGDGTDGLWVDGCTDKTPHYSGIWSFNGLRTQGLLQEPEAAQAPWTRHWDSVSLTPWLFNPQTKQFISYDDPSSIAAKASYVAEHGLAGVSVYDITMDHGSELMDAIRKSLTPDAPASAASTTTTTSSSSTTETSSSATSSPLSTSSPASSTPSPSSTSPEPAPPTSASAGNGSGDKPVAGGHCGADMRYRCAEADGKDPHLFVCAVGMWFAQQCGTGTACIQSGDTVYCDWPR